MLYVGIDVAKDKHDCHIFDSDGVVWQDNFSFPNSKAGFEKLLATIYECIQKTGHNAKIGLEDTVHYLSNLLAFSFRTRLYRCAVQSAVRQPVKIRRYAAQNKNLQG